MARDADAHKAEDERRRQEVEARNQLDSAVYSAEKTLKDHRDKVSAEDAKAVEDAIADAQSALKDGNLDRMKQAQEKLLTASHKLAEAMYKATGSQTPPPGGGPAGAAPGGDGAASGGQKKDNVVDAEFVDVDDKK